MVAFLYRRIVLNFCATMQVQGPSCPPFLSNTLIERRYPTPRFCCRYLLGTSPLSFPHDPHAVPVIKVNRAYDTDPRLAVQAATSVGLSGMLFQK